MIGIRPETVMECCGHDGTYAMRVEGFETSARVGKKAFDGMKKADSDSTKGDHACGRAPSVMFSTVQNEAAQDQGLFQGQEGRRAEPTRPRTRGSRPKQGQA